MATVLLDGHRKWSMTRDKDGHREYRIVYLVQGISADGPANVIQTPGLPLPGSHWEVDHDIDIWAFCQWDATVRQVLDENEPNYLWEVEFTYTTRPPDTKHCRDGQVEDPLLEPNRISISFSSTVEEMTTASYIQWEDGEGVVQSSDTDAPMVNSSWERIRGSQAEFESDRFQVRIEQNVANLELPLLALMRNTVNKYPLWGMAARTIRLARVSIEFRYYGFCNVYFVRVFEFEINPNGWDREFMDEGTMVQQGHWDKETGAYVVDLIGLDVPDPEDPSHFCRFKDRAGENASTPLDGRGLPAGAKVGKGATAVLEIVDAEGGIGFINVTNGGFGYVGTVTATAVGMGEGAVLSVVVDNGVITNIDATEPGSGYVVGLTDIEISGEGGPGLIHIEYYPESDFLLLGIPTELG